MFTPLLMQEQLFQFRVGLLILAIALQLTGKNITDDLVNPVAGARLVDR